MFLWCCVFYSLHNFLISLRSRFFSNMHCVKYVYKLVWINYFLFHKIMLYLETVKTLVKNEFSPRVYYSYFRQKWDHILLGGSLDGLTTLIAISLSFNELNPLINHLLPEHVHLVPFILVEMAFLRYVVVFQLFKRSRYLNYAVYFTLYFLPIWNTSVILQFFL